MADMPAINAAFRRKYGIPPKGDRTAPDSEWGFPLPPADHPNAKAFARAVIDRAHQATNFAPADVAKQVAKAKRILAAATREGAAPWRSIRWVNAAARTKKGYALATPRKAETVREFFARVPAAVPIDQLRSISEFEKRSIALRAPLRRLSESALATAERLQETAFSDVALREASVAADGTVKNVLLIRSGPGNLGDRHYYPDALLKSAVAAGLFEGARMYLDHPDEVSERVQPGRSVRDLAGFYSDAYTRSYVDPELGRTTLGVFATFHPAVDDPKVASLVRTCVEYAKRFPTKAYAGLSIMAFGEGSPGLIDGEEWNIVSVISQIDSVDMVTKAGAGGSLVPLIKESYSMPKTKPSDSLNVELTVDDEKVRTGVLSLITEAKKGASFDVKALLKEAGVETELTDDQVAKISEHLGKPFVGLTEEAIEKVISDATNVASPTLNEGGAKTEDDGDDDMSEDAIDKMSPAQLKAALKKSNTALEASRKKEAAAVSTASKLGEQASLTVRTRMAEEVAKELNIPEPFVGRLVREIVREGYTTKADALNHAREFDLVFVRKPDGAGSVALSERGGAGAPKIDLQFAEEG